MNKDARQEVPGEYTLPEVFVPHCLRARLAA